MHSTKALQDSHQNFRSTDFDVLLGLIQFIEAWLGMSCLCRLRDDVLLIVVHQFDRLISIHSTLPAVF